jgi:hypothetical protein
MTVRPAACAALLLLSACRQAAAPANVRLIDLFDKAKVEGTPRGKALPPAAAWNFGQPEGDGKDPMLGWKSDARMEGWNRRH